MGTNEPVLRLADGRYEILNPEPLGEGHFGKVFDAKDSLLDVRVAIKLFEDGFAPDQAIIEAQVQHRLSDHPNVVSILNVVPDPPRPFVVMEFIDGGSVGDRLGNDEISVVESLRWIRDGLAGLGHAHDLGILHRDFKPGNLLVVESGGAVLSDFGLAEDTVRAITAAQDYDYSPHAAPELSLSGSSVATDIWAVGCTLFRLLTGEYPFADEIARDRVDFIRPHRLNPQLPLRLTRVVERALALDPAKRFATAGEMEAAVASCGMRYGWTRIANPGCLEAWEATTNHGKYRVTVLNRPKVGIEVVATCDKGRGPRRVGMKRCTSVAKANQLVRRLLISVSENGCL
jgi:serine/threonine-protein kinase